VNPSQALIIGVCEDGKDQRMVNGNKPIHWIIDNFSFGRHHAIANLFQLLAVYKNTDTQTNQTVEKVTKS
jgi:hypothetical protein